MNKVKIFLLLSLTLVSCNEEVKKSYYQSGNPKQFDFYSSQEILDSSITYYDHFKHPIKKKLFLKDSTTYVKNFSDEGILTSEGYLNSQSHRIGKWMVYTKDTLKILEYKNIRGEEYLNQSWMKNSIGDTVRGNYYSLQTKDTLNVKEFVTLKFFLERPIISLNSELLLLLPKGEEKFASDFSNESEVEVDTILSLKHDPLNKHLEGMPLIHMLMVNIEFANPGKKKIRGILKETHEEDFGDSIVVKERNIYLEKAFFVRETTGK
ncbi:hypothetical protein V6B16_14790 [Salinimicrobium catena]|uniref:hypothetical protein n=1 Tax=Salinimicrobium catena TaxID=390640 RepID=UPI002FE4BE04